MNMNYFVKGFISILGFFFQYEFLLVKMFNYLVKKNNLDNEFKCYFGKNLVKDKYKMFIIEMIKGLLKIKFKVQEFDF